MIAEVGGIVNVRGRRMATPLAPPSPGSTPMIVPSVMPMTATNRLNGVMAMWKPRAMFSNPTGQSTSGGANAAPPRHPPPVSAGADFFTGLSVPQPGLERSLGHRHEEPGLEDEERRDGDEDGEADHHEPGVAADPSHVKRHVECCGHVETDELHE